jgi:hypothetical protein
MQMKAEMDLRLDYHNGFLCVLVDKRANIVTAAGPVRIRKWFPVREAAREEAVGLVGRVLRQVDEGEGLYVDENGEAFSLLHGKEMEALEVEIVRSGDQSEVNGSGPARPAPLVGENARLLLTYRSNGDSPDSTGDQSKAEQIDLEGGRATCADSDRATALLVDPKTGANRQLSLKEKLVEIRRRIGQIEKRGINQSGNYRYVRAADLAGPIGDLLAQFGVILLPRLESIYSVPVTDRTGQDERTHVVVAYTFVDAKTSEELTVKLAGTGIDPGDKAVAKAQTCALKYALLQTFLIATGDDPENECAAAPHHGENSRQGQSSKRITAAQAREIGQLIEDTATELARVLEYFNVASIENMSEADYRKALAALRKKLAKASAQEAHAA